MTFSGRLEDVSVWPNNFLAELGDFLNYQDNV